MAKKQGDSKKLATLKIALENKQADLDALDNEIMDLDTTMPMDTGGEKFDLLAEKREELEKEIRSMRERVQLITEWEKFKSGDWSDTVRMDLNNLDQEFANIAEGTDGAGIDPLAPVSPVMDAPMPDVPAMPDVPLAPETPVAPEAPASTSMDAPMPDAPPAAAPAEPLAPPMASKSQQINKKNNYQLQDKKGSSTLSTLKKGDNTMANQPTQPSLKEKLAEVKSKREAISKEAKTRVASAWTIAKTMLPTAPHDVQKGFALNLLQNSTKLLKAALRQTAINAHYSKVAETFKEVHKVELNDLLEDPSVLNKEKKAVESELKSEAKNASVDKVADDRKDAGPQPDKYDDGRDGSEPKEMDASKAGERDMATVNKSEGDKKSAAKEAAAKSACGDKCAGCDECGKKAADEKADEKKDEKKAADKVEDKKEEKKEAAAKKADEAPMPTPPAAPEAPMGDAPPMDEPPMPEEAPAMPEEAAPAPDDAAGAILTDEKKMVVEEKIEEAQEAIKALESEILEESEEELDLAKVFDADDMEEKVSALANEGEEHTAGEEDGDNFFAPSAASSLEASMDDDGMADMHDMFSMQGADGDPLATLMASLKTAQEVAGIDIVPSSTGEAAAHFEQEESQAESRNNESDHDGDLFAEAIEGITPEEQGSKRLPQDSEPKLEAPKAASPKKATLRRVKPVAAAEESTDIASALMGNFEE